MRLTPDAFTKFDRPKLQYPPQYIQNVCSPSSYHNSDAMTYYPRILHIYPLCQCLCLCLCLFLSICLILQSGPYHLEAR